MSSTHRYCTFTLDRQLYGIDIELVQEVLIAAPITQLPLATRAVRGLLHLRGQIVPALDLTRCLELEERPLPAAPAHVVVHDGKAPASLLVDAPGDVLRVNAECIEPRPETLRGPGRELIRHVCKLEGRLLLVLDLEKVLQTAFA